MQTRIWGPAQEDIVETFRKQVSNTPAREGCHHPYYIALQDKGRVMAVLRIEDCLSDGESSFNDGHRGPQIHLSQLTCRQGVSPAAAVAAMTPTIFQLIAGTYQTYKPIRLTFGFTDDREICERLMTELSKLCELAAYKFKTDLPTAPMPAVA